MAELTPMMQQYREIKSRNPDCLLFFRLGDFYEMFDEDARLASCRNGLFFVPLILLLPGLRGITGVEMSQPAADFLTFLVSVPFQIWFFRHKLR